MKKHSGIRRTFTSLFIIGLVSTVFAADKVHPTPGAVQLGNFDEAKTRIEPYNDAGGGKRSKAKTAIVNDAIEGENALQFTYKLDGWCGIALARTNAKKLEWDWSAYDKFSFWYKGQNSGVKFGLDLEDKSSERLTVYFTDDSTEWKHVVIPLSDFKYREDYQDPSASVNGMIDYPVKAFAIYPLTPNVEAQILFDSFEVLPKE